MSWWQSTKNFFGRFSLRKGNKVGPSPEDNLNLDPYKLEILQWEKEMRAQSKRGAWGSKRRKDLKSKTVKGQIPCKNEDDRNSNGVDEAFGSKEVGENKSISEVSSHDHISPQDHNCIIEETLEDLTLNRNNEPTESVENGSEVKVKSGQELYHYRSDKQKARSWPGCGTGPHYYWEDVYETLYLGYSDYPDDEEGERWIKFDDDLPRVSTVWEKKAIVEVWVNDTVRLVSELYPYSESETSSDDEIFPGGRFIPMNPDVVIFYRRKPDPIKLLKKMPSPEWCGCEKNDRLNRVHLYNICLSEPKRQLTKISRDWNECITESDYDYEDNIREKCFFHMESDNEDSRKGDLTSTVDIGYSSFGSTDGEDSDANNISKRKNLNVQDTDPISQVLDRKFTSDLDQEISNASQPSTENLGLAAIPKNENIVTGLSTISHENADRIGSVRKCLRWIARTFGKKDKGERRRPFPRRELDEHRGLRPIF